MYAHTHNTHKPAARTRLQASLDDEKRHFCGSCHSAHDSTTEKVDAERVEGSLGRRKEVLTDEVRPCEKAAVENAVAVCVRQNALVKRRQSFLCNDGAEAMYCIVVPP